MILCRSYDSIWSMKIIKGFLPAIVIFGMFVLVGGLGVFVVGMSNDVKPRSLAESGQVAEAVVFDKVAKEGFRQSLFFLVYEFENGNKMKENVEVDRFNNIKIGEEVEVCFNDTYFTAFFEECGTSS